MSTRNKSVSFFQVLFVLTKEGSPMTKFTFGVLVVCGSSLLAIGSALAQAGSAGSGAAGSGSESSSGSGMTSQGLASEPAGIGEKGTGQTQSTLERSGKAQAPTSEPS